MKHDTAPAVLRQTDGSVLLLFPDERQVRVLPSSEIDGLAFVEWTVLVFLVAAKGLWRALARLRLDTSPGTH